MDEATDDRRARRAKRPHDPARSRRVILETATAEFAERGYAGARVDRIAAEAGVSKNLIYHYFASKEALYTQCLHDALADLRRAQDDQEVRSMPPVAGMRRLVDLTFTYFHEHPDLIRLLVSENMLKGRHIRHSLDIIQLYDPLQTTLGELLAAGAAEGAFRRDVDPRDLYISIAGLCIFYFSHRYTMGAVFRVDLLDPVILAARKRHVIDMVMGYLQSPAMDATAPHESGGAAAAAAARSRHRPPETKP